MSTREALELLGNKHPGMRCKYISQQDRDDISRLIEQLQRENDELRETDRRAS